MKKKEWKAKFASGSADGQSGRDSDSEGEGEGEGQPQSSDTAVVSAASENKTEDGKP